MPSPDEIRKNGPRGLEDILGKNQNGPAPETAPAPAVDESDLPDPGSPYQAHARPANKAVYALHCLLGKEGIRSFQYVQMDSGSKFEVGEHGQIIRLRFAGTKIWELTITGLNLWRLYDLTHQHRTAWIRKSDRGFAAMGDGEPIIMGIEIKEIERREG